ncbi:MAG TPA: hypothetical protein VN517_16560 [Terriglobales bacterium]|nr:hypothetical protein [Terriglobales bacterium]
MKQIVLVTALLALTSPVFAQKQNKNGTFTGEIMDKPCAQMGSHANMMKEEGAKDARDCTLKCVKSGASFVLFDPATKKVYPIADQEKVREYAGQHVQVTGTYDDADQLLHVKSVAPGAK